MKKITLVVCLLCIAFVNAQDDQNQTADKLTFQKGTQSVNANFSIGISDSKFTSATNESNTDNFGFSIGTAYSYAVSDNLFLGLGLGYSHNKQQIERSTTPDESEAVNSSYQIAPFVRYYKGIGTKFAFFIQGETRFSRAESEIDTNGKFKSNNLFIGVRPGFTLMLNKNIGLETTIGALGYTKGSSESEAGSGTSDTKAFNLSLNTSNVFFGLNYYF